MTRGPVLPERIRRAVTCFARLPGVGEKTALRFVMHLLTTDESVARDLGEELLSLHEHVRPCERCGHLADRRDDGSALCAVCSDPQRDATVLCVVAKVQDLLAIERSGAMRGRYFVLGKVLSPLEGVVASDIPVDRLRRRIVEDGVREVIVATPPSVDGEATALFLAQELADLEVVLTRLASGVPHGGDLEYADQITIGRAIDGRRGMSGGRGDGGLEGR
jgi:recombination protein RecR